MEPNVTPGTTSPAWPARIREAAGPWTVTVAVLTVVVTVVQADLRTPLQLPGHRGVLWLGLLVATALLARRGGIATATGLVSSGLVLGLGLSPAGVAGVLPYVLAAVALDVLMRVAVIRARPWLVAVLAAPVHLVALVAPVMRGARAGMGAMPATSTLVLFHLLFGLVAGVVGWVVWRMSRGRARTE